jgi:hypothetical protein
MAILRCSRLPLNRQASGDLDAVERFKGNLLRTRRSDPIIERRFVLPFRESVSELPCLHVLDRCVLQHWMARNYLNVRRFTGLPHEDKGKLHDSFCPGLARQWGMPWYVCGYKHRFALCRHRYGERGGETKHSANADVHRSALPLKIVRWFRCLTAVGVVKGDSAH